MRGKVSKRLFISAGCGITPAYAGKSYASFLGLALVLDHPRVCGEKTKKIP